MYLLMECVRNVCQFGSGMDNPLRRSSCLAVEDESRVIIAFKS